MVGDPEHAADERLVDLRFARGDHLVQRRDRVAHRALALVGDQERRAVREPELDPVGRGRLALLDLEQTIRHAPDRHAREVEPLRARADRVGELLRIGGGEDEHEVRRRLLQRLQECRERVARELVHLVDDHHAVAAAGGREAHALAQLLDVGDPAVARAVDFEDVERDAGRDLGAARAFAARFTARLARGSRAPLAVESLGENPRARRLPHPAGAGEQERLRDAAGLERGHEDTRDVLLPHEVGEDLRPVLERERAMGHGTVPPAARPPAGGVAAPGRRCRVRSRCREGTSPRAGVDALESRQGKGPGGPAAHPKVCLPLLPSGPDGVHKSGLRWAWPKSKAMVEMIGIEPTTSSLRTRRSPN